VVVLDVRLPGMDGESVLRELRRRPETSGVPVLMLSAGSPAGDWAGVFPVPELDRGPFRRRLRAACPTLFAPARRPTAMVVDDDPMSRMYLKELLTAEGVDVIEVADGAEVLARVESRPPDVVLVDLRMPGVDGFTIVEALRRKYDRGRLPVFVVTGLEMTAEERARLNGRVQGVLPKHRLTRERLRHELAGTLAGA
jgi:CheY-like chemotaxis protein